jgi:diguanylate cyclase (GGDEF)-like protein
MLRDQVADTNERETNQMGSFKVKLVVYFLLLALVPLGAAFWGFSAVIRRGDRQRVDARLEGGLRAALTAYQDEVMAAGRRATRLARDPDFQHALEHGDSSVLHHALQGTPHARVLVGRAGVAPTSAGPLAARRVVSVVSGNRLLGAIVIDVPLDASLLSRLQRRAGLADEDTLVVLDRGTIAVGPGGLVGLVFPAGPGRARGGKIGDTSYRMLATSPLPEPSHASLAVLSPQAAIDSADMSANRRLAAILLAALALIGTVAYALSRSIVRLLENFVRGARAIASGRLQERVPVRGRDEFAQLGHAFNEMAQQLELRMTELEEERRRVREVTRGFVDVLAATHDLAQLRRVIVDTAVDATGAVGGAIRFTDGEICVGDLGYDGERLQLPLVIDRQSFGTLILVGDGFTDDERERAALLAGQGVVALENARLHAIVERQAAQDELTGLPNRRRSEQLLRDELHRAQRFGGQFALVFADIDDFKAINDRYGHPTGDVVLREFADTILETVREVDHPARWGGEEFAILLPGADADGAARLAERLRCALEDRPIVAASGEEFHATASFGIAAFPDEPSAHELVAAADAALYDAKRTGKNRVAAAQPALAA